MEITLEEAFKGGSKQILLNGQKISLKLKPGIYDGEMLWMKEKGAKGINGGSNGDLIITIHILKHNRYKLSGSNLHFEQPLDLYTAVLGGKLNINVFDKVLNITIPVGNNSGDIFRLKGLGMTKNKNINEKGDAYVKVMIQVPKNLTLEQKELIKQLSQQNNLKHA